MNPRAWVAGRADPLCSVCAGTGTIFVRSLQRRNGARELLIWARLVPCTVAVFELPASKLHPITQADKSERCPSCLMVTREEVRKLEGATVAFPRRSR